MILFLSGYPCFQLAISGIAAFVLGIGNVAVCLRLNSIAWMIPLLLVEALALDLIRHYFAS